MAPLHVLIDSILNPYKNRDSLQNLTNNYNRSNLIGSPTAYNLGLQPQNIQNYLFNELYLNMPSIKSTPENNYHSLYNQMLYNNYYSNPNTSRLPEVPVKNQDWNGDYFKT